MGNARVPKDDPRLLFPSGAGGGRGSLSSSRPFFGDLTPLMLLTWEEDLLCANWNEQKSSGK